jgi:heat shock protein HslJ
VVGHDLVAGTSVALTFEGERLSTNAGCNTASGAYRIADSVLQIGGEWASTLKGCAPELEAQDQWLAEFLDDAPSVALDGDVLTLTGADGGEVVITLEAGGADAAALIGTTWMLNSVLDGSSASSVPAGVDPPTMTIGEDGMAELFTGCNRGSSAVGTTTTERGELLTFSPVRLTKMACEAGAAELEGVVLAVLESQPAFEIVGDKLTLTAPDETGLEFRAA